MTSPPMARFDTWPLVVTICCGWTLMILMYIGKILNHHRRTSTVHQVCPARACRRQTTPSWCWSSTSHIQP
jgi:hypothetical protein